MKPQSNIYSRYFTYIKPLVKLPLVRTYGTTIFTLVMIIIFIFFAIKPTVETILVLQKKLENSDAILKKLEIKGESLALAKKNYDNLDNEIKDKIQGYIPDSIDLKSIIQKLEQSAKNHDASISALQFQPQILEAKSSNKSTTLQEVGFTFNIEANYANLTSVLQDLTTSTRLISIDSLSINKVSEGKGVIMSLNGKAWYMK